MDAFELTRANIENMLEKYKGQEEQLFSNAMKPSFLIPFAKTISASNIIVTGEFGSLLVETLDELGIVKKVLYVIDDLQYEDYDDHEPYEEYVFINVTNKDFEKAYEIANQRGITISEIIVLF